MEIEPEPIDDDVVDDDEVLEAEDADTAEDDPTTDDAEQVAAAAGTTEDAPPSDDESSVRSSDDDPADSETEHPPADETPAPHASAHPSTTPEAEASDSDDSSGASAPVVALPPTPRPPAVPSAPVASAVPRLEPPLPSVSRSVPAPPMSSRPVPVPPPPTDGDRREDTDARRLPPVALPSIPAPPPSPEEIARSGGLLGQVLADRYRVDRLLAEGAMGQVFVGEHVMMKKKIAIKVLKRSLTRVPEVVARFEREARAAANIEHQNVVAATDFGTTDDGAVFIVLEYVEGTSLRDVLSNGPLPLARALGIGRQIAAALAAAHALDIVHRDLKPENVMVLTRPNDEDLVKVLDFGIAKVPAAEESDDDEDSHSITNPGMVFGTPEYMSPEQGLGQEVDARADIYSLGVILFEMLAGKLPFDSEEGILGQQLKGKIPRVSERNPEVVVPTTVNSLLASMLTSDVGDRLQGAKEALRSFDALLADFGDDVPARSSVTSSPGRALQNSVAELNVKAEALVGKLPESIRNLPPKILIGAPAALLVLLVLLVTMGGSDDEAVQASADPSAKPAVSAAPKPEPERKLFADDEELSVAKAAGLTVLEELAGKYPKDAKVHVAYARMLSKEQKHTKAVDEVQVALGLDEQTVGDGQVATVLWAGAQSKARKATFELLTGKMGSKGADILYDLAVVEGVRASTQTMAQKHLATREFAQAATPEASIAADLFTATSCQTRKALLKRAENVGDFRSLDLLKQFEAGNGCKEGEEGECNACLRGTDPLTEAMKALESRAAEKKADAPADEP